MCGVAGYIHLEHGPKTINSQYLAAMQQSLQHRGPDGQALWFSHEHAVGFAHRRLSIVDLSPAGLQPMHDAENTVVLMCNGEIYNHPHLHHKLTALGCHYRSTSDTETILHAYKQWGIAAMHHLQGMFAIALYDLKSRNLYLIRDRMGIKPLYFSLQNNIVSFASEIKALFCLPWISRTINQSAVHHYLTHLATPAPLTLYQGIYKLPAGYYLHVNEQKQVTFCEWYNPLKPYTVYDQQDLADEQFCHSTLHHLLDNALQQHTMSDVPYGVFLSGGIDSSLNVAFLSQHKEKLKTFTIAFGDGPEYQEIEWARAVAQQYRTDHHELIISEKEAFEFFSTMIYHQDEPLADSVCIPLYYIARLARDSGVIVIQAGEGADELFGGYGDYLSYLQAHAYAQQTTYIPAFAKKLVYHLARLATDHPHRQRFTMMHQWARNQSVFIASALAFPDTVKSDFVHTVPCQEQDPIVAAIYPELVQTTEHDAFSAYHLKNLYAHHPAADFFTAMSYVELKQRLPELLLMRMDKMTMAASVETRVPYLDHTIVEFALQMPTVFKCRNNSTKYMLKKVAESFFEPSFIYRPKMGFPTPTARWLAHGNYFKPYFLSLLDDHTNPWREYINIASIKKLISHHEQYQDCSAALWTIQNLMATQG